MTLTYLEDGKLKTVEAGQVVLACWHRVIPYITDELGEAQIEALNDQVKMPLIYTNVLIRNWEAFDKLEIGGFSAPKCFWDGVEIDYPVSIGNYKFADKPSDPVLLHLSKMPLSADGLSARDQATAGRYSLTDITFEDMEREIRDLLGRALKDGGFDAARDIEAITCNRWTPRLRARIHAAVGRVLARRAAADRDVAQGLGPDRHRQLGRRRLRLCALGDRPGRPCGQRPARGHGQYAVTRRLSGTAARPDRALSSAFR